MCSVWLHSIVFSHLSPAWHAYAWFIVLELNKIILLYYIILCYVLYILMIIIISLFLLATAAQLSLKRTPIGLVVRQTL